VTSPAMAARPAGITVFKLKSFYGKQKTRLRSQAGF
jgi:hypothetical protein